MEIFSAPANKKSPNVKRPFDRTPDHVLIERALTDAAWQLGIEPSESSPWQPCTFFFYGSLMNPTVAQAILRLPHVPVLRPGKIYGFKKRMWGAFPALVRSEGHEVQGVTFEMQDEQQFRRLQHYETSSYCWCYCDIETEDGSIIKGGRTFRWAGHPDSSELEDVDFDMHRFEKDTLPFMIGRRWGFRRLELQEKRGGAQKPPQD
jgi:hypothetical protein